MGGVCVCVCVCVVAIAAIAVVRCSGPSEERRLSQTFHYFSHYHAAEAVAG